MHPVSKHEEYGHLLQHMTECPFCDIEPGLLVASGKHVYMTLSIAPYHQDHILIIPFRHVESLLDLSEDEHKEVTQYYKLGIRLMQTLGHTDATVLVREGAGSGKSISHVHYHVIPDVVMRHTVSPIDRLVLSEEERKEEIRRLRQAFFTKEE